MSHSHTIRMRGLARGATVAGSAPEGVSQIEHGLNAYRSGKCRCDVCKEAHRIKSKEYRDAIARGEVRKREPRSVRVERAKVFLEDGASYAEAARSTGTSEETLAKDLPGYESNFSDFNSIMSTIKNHETLLELHREIWQGGRYNKS